MNNPNKFKFKINLSLISLQTVKTTITTKYQTDNYLNVNAIQS